MNFKPPGSLLVVREGSKWLRCMLECNLVSLSWLAHCISICGFPFCYPTRPVKFLDSTRYRVIYCMALSAWAGDVLKSVSDSTQFIRHKDKALLDAFYFFSEYSGWTPQ